jgi:hypothetical protein
MQVGMRVESVGLFGVGEWGGSSCNKDGNQLGAGVSVTVWVEVREINERIVVLPMGAA